MSAVQIRSRYSIVKIMTDTISNVVIPKRTSSGKSKVSTIIVIRLALISIIIKISKILLIMFPFDG